MMHAIFLGAGLCWTATYLLIIRRGLADRTYGMPIVALCANISWEFIFSIVRPQTGVGRVIDIVWLIFDVVIAYTALRFGPREFANVPRTVFYAGFAGTLVLSYLGVDTLCREFDDGNGTYAAFGSNLMMSGLFLAMLAGRRSLRGQSVPIAAAKFAGTALASIGTWRYGNHPDSVALAYLYVASAVVDIAYLAAVVAMRVRPAAVTAAEADDSAQVMALSR